MNANERHEVLRIENESGRNQTTRGHIYVNLWDLRRIPCEVFCQYVKSVSMNKIKILKSRKFVLWCISKSFWKRNRDSLRRLTIVMMMVEMICD
jgi:hypothetical protein